MMHLQGGTADQTICLNIKRSDGMRGKTFVMFFETNADRSHVAKAADVQPMGKQNKITQI